MDILGCLLEQTLDSSIFLELANLKVFFHRRTGMSAISISQALAELKLLRKRIQTATSNSVFTTLKKKRDLLDVPRFTADAQASYQSYRDLLNRYNSIKAAIVLSNATTLVSIAGTEYTVADAVERKKTIEMEKNMLHQMQMQYDKVKNDYDSHTSSENARVERLIQTELGKDSKTNVEVITQLSETFLAQNRAEIIDPLNLGKEIVALNKTIEDFETKVDWILSESNGRTTICV